MVWQKIRRGLTLERGGTFHATAGHKAKRQGLAGGRRKKSVVKTHGGSSERRGQVSRLKNGSLEKFSGLCGRDVMLKCLGTGPEVIRAEE